MNALMDATGIRTKKQTPNAHCFRSKANNSDIKPEINNTNCRNLNSDLELALRIAMPDIFSPGKWSGKLENVYTGSAGRYPNLVVILWFLDIALAAYLQFN
jgi:hypothetical protein